MSSEKIDYPPLLAQGVHKHTLESLEAFTVTAFPKSTRRKPLFDALEVYLQMLRSLGMKGRAVIDGSFITEKVEPDDIDLVLVANHAALSAAPAECRNQLAILTNTGLVKARFNLHVFLVLDTDEEQLAYWLKFFGTQRDEITPKGLAEVRIDS
tara:strand:+ start:1787 stop:2248 length:462 start_codon:yes stop_codon:yes gene_type:complete